jgi:hypothetical protein
VYVPRWNHRSTHADTVQKSSLDYPAGNVPNLDHLLLVHHVNLSDLAVYRIRKYPLMVREHALTNLLELTTLRPPGYLRPLAGRAHRPFD